MQIIYGAIWIGSTDERCFMARLQSVYLHESLAWRCVGTTASRRRCECMGDGWVCPPGLCWATFMCHDDMGGRVMAVAFIFMFHWWDWCVVLFLFVFTKCFLFRQNVPVPGVVFMCTNGVIIWKWYYSTLCTTSVLSFWSGSGCYLLWRLLITSVTFLTDKTLFGHGHRRSGANVVILADMMEWLWWCQLSNLSIKRDNLFQSLCFWVKHF